MYKVHTRLIFCPMHYFFVWIVSKHNECSTLLEAESFDLHCKSYFFGVTILLTVINFCFALFKEMVIYSIKQDKDVLSSKSNFYFQTQLLHKAIIPIFIMMLSDTKEIIFVFNLVFSLGYCYHLVRSFPFFNILVQKISFCYAAAHLSSSFFAFAFSFDKGEEYFEIMTIIMFTMVYRVLIVYFDFSLKRIFDMRFWTPEEALHISLLLKTHTKKYSTISKLENNYREGSFYLYGFLKSYGIDAKNLVEFETMKDYELELYTLVLKKLNDLRKKYPKNDLLLLLIIEIYVKKLGNASRAITLLNHMRDNRSSIQIQLAVRELYQKLERKYCNIDSNTDLEVLRYFQFRDDVNELKENIQNEISKQIKVWKEMSLDNMNVKTVVDISEEIDILHKASKKMWQTNYKGWEMSFASPFLMYGIYLDVVRKNQFDGLKAIEKFYEIRKIRSHFKKEMSAFSEEIAILLGSIETERPGIIIDASSSVQGIFKITRDMLVGQRIDALLPRFVAKKHEGMIKKYSQNSRHDLNRQWNTYARTVDGSLFQAEVRLKIYPYINRGLNLIAQVRRIQNPEIIMVVDGQGLIVDCSEELLPILNLTKRDLDTTKINDVCPGFKVIDHAMHFLFDGGKEVIMSHMPSSMNGQRNNERRLSSVIQQEEFDSSDDDDTATDQDGYKLASSEKDQTPFHHHHLDKMTASFDLKKTLETNHKPTFIPGKTLLLAPTLDPSRAGSMTTTQSPKKAARDIVKKFKNGVNLNFVPKAVNGLQRKSGETRLDLDVIVEPNVMDGVLYKVVKFPGLHHLGAYSTSLTMKTLDFTHQHKHSRQKSHQHHAHHQVSIAHQPPSEFKLATADEFADNFPTMNERSEHSRIDEVQPKVIIMRNPSKVGADQMTPDEGKRVSKGSTGHTISLNHLKDQLLIAPGFSKKNEGGENSSSLKTSSHREIRVAKALNDLFDRKTMRPVTKLTIFIVYLAMIIVLALASLEYIFSNRSFTQMQDGAMVINTASNRLLNFMICWEYMLIFYTRANGLRPINSGLLVFQATLVTHALDLMEQDVDLQNRLQASGNTDLLDTFFEKNLYMYLPGEGVTFSGGPVDTFIAARVLENKYLKAGRWTTQSPLLLNGDEDCLFAINSTCNEVLVNSQNQVSQTEQIVSDIISTNKTLVAVLLGLETFAISSVVLFLLLVIRVIILSYAKLFRVLSRIKEDVFLQRVAELHAIREVFTKNVEGKEFSQRITSYLENEHRQVKQGVKSKGKIGTGSSRHREDKFIMRDLTKKALKNLVLACVLVFVISAGFFTAYFTANSTFNDLEIKNDRLTIAHKLGYSFDQLLGAFYSVVVFYNETDYTIKYEKPIDQFYEVQDFVSTANEQLVSSLTDQNTGEIDATLEDFLRSDMCSYIDESMYDTCISVQQKGAIGLMDMNTQYYQYNKQYFEQFIETPTFVSAQTLLVNYATAVTSMLNLFPYAYEFLRTYLVDSFNEKIDSQKSQSLTIFIIILVALVVSTCIIQIVTITRLREIDVGIRKILKILPFSMIQENRLLGFYLKNEFKKELDDVKQFV